MVVASSGGADIRRAVAVVHHTNQHQEEWDDAHDAVAPARGGERLHRDDGDILDVLEATEEKGRDGACAYQAHVEECACRAADRHHTCDEVLD